MALAPQLQLRQSQTLVMTPQLQQAIKLLQLSNLELSTFVEGELERNPLLERLEGDAPPGDNDSLPTRDDSPIVEPLRLNDAEPSAAVADAIDAEVRNDFTTDSGSDLPAIDPSGPGTTYGARGGNAQFDGGEGSLEETLTAHPTLREHLRGQLALSRCDGLVALVASQIIDLLDEAGFLRDALADVALRLGCPLDIAETALAVVQGFEPTGVGARDLGECLALQLRERNRCDPAMAAFVANLDMVARRDIAGLMKICGVDAEDIQDMLREIRALDPRPARAFAAEPTVPVVPDVFVRRQPDNSWHIELNSDTLPRVLVNQRYHASVAGAARGKNDKAYLSDCLSSANWLVKSLDQRANTILKVASEIVRQQDAFLEHGVQHLRPLNLRTVAEAISMHESTVSRVTANKYIATPRGVLEMKYFFTSSIASVDGGEAHSAEAVRQRIRELIDRETADTVLSDDKLVEILVKSGIDIARRTVAKYREALRIPSSVQRRRMLMTTVETV